MKGRDKVIMTSFAGGGVSDNISTLAFPSISTADFQFNLEKAFDIIVGKVEEFIRLERLGLFWYICLNDQKYCLCLGLKLQK